MRSDLFVKLKYESSTMILFVGIWHSVRDLLSDLNDLMGYINQFIIIIIIIINYAWPAN